MKRYTFTLEEAQEIKAAREKNRDKNVEKDWQHLRCEQKGSRTKKFVKNRLPHAIYYRAGFPI